jgi:hypothetical protein
MKILGNYCFLGDLRGKAPKAKDGVFLCQRLIFSVGGKIK